MILGLPAMAKIVYACAKFTRLKKRKRGCLRFTVGKRGYVPLESKTTKMGARMAVQLYSEQWKSIIVIPISVRFAIKLTLTRTCFMEVYSAVSGMINFTLLRLETKCLCTKQDLIGHDLTANFSGLKLLPGSSNLN